MTISHTFIQLNYQRLCAAICILTVLTSPTHAQDTNAFIKHEIESYQWLNDFVLVDLNNDHLLDFYSNNHGLRPRILLNNDNYRLDLPDEDSPFALHQLLNDLTPSFDLPVIDKPGLYLYYDGLRAKIVGHNLEFPLGNLTLTGDSEDSFRVVDPLGDVYYTIPSQIDCIKQLEISLGQSFELTLSPAKNRNVLFVHAIIPYSVRKSDIFIGPRAIESDYNQVTFTGAGTQDWHNSIWFDFNADNMLDAFITQGGSNGYASTDHRVFNDLLFLSGRSPLAYDAALESGIVKNGLPGRGAMIADVDNNGLPDIYIRNSRERPPRQNASNLLHMQMSPMEFQEEADQRNLNIKAPGIGKWIDIDSDGWIDLVWGDHTQIKLFRNNNGIFQEEIITDEVNKVNYVSWITYADFDNDADIDLAIAAYPNSLILVNNDGKLEPKPFSSFGLPKNSRGVQWVDYDNDGLLDLYTRPNGLFRQTKNNTFVKSGLLIDEPIWHPFTWGDMNNDGRMDLVRRTNHDPDTTKDYTNTQGESVSLRTPPNYTISVFENTISNDNSWIEIKLVGPDQNPQAIGATVLLQHNDTKQLAAVGQLESSQSSVGHYRLHFGLGDMSTTQNNPSITIHWPDGTIQPINNLSPNMLHVINHPTP